MGATTTSRSLRQRIVSHLAPFGVEVHSPPAAIGLPEVRLNSAPVSSYLVSYIATNTRGGDHRSWLFPLCMMSYVKGRLLAAVLS